MNEKGGGDRGERRLRRTAACKRNLHNASKGSAQRPPHKTLTSTGAPGGSVERASRRAPRQRRPWRSPLTPLPKLLPLLPTLLHPLLRATSRRGATAAAAAAAAGANGRAARSCATLPREHAAPRWRRACMLARIGAV